MLDYAVMLRIFLKGESFKKINLKIGEKCVSTYMSNMFIMYRTTGRRGPYLCVAHHNHCPRIYIKASSGVVKRCAG
jgi:hypothetical protein